MKLFTAAQVGKMQTEIFTRIEKINKAGKAKNWELAGIVTSGIIVYGEAMVSEEVLTEFWRLLNSKSQKPRKKQA